MSEPRPPGRSAWERMRDNPASADDEAFVTGLTQQLVLLIHGWRNAANMLPDGMAGTKHAYREAARELEAVLRNAT